MKKLKNLFGDLNMTWAKVLLLAVVTGVYTGVIKSISALDNTSFQDIAVMLEWWFLFALFIIVNCRKWWEASLKCFVFFLLSQPLVYLVQVPFNPMGWKIFGYYPRWFYITLLTLPGAAVAYLVKKKNWLSVPVLSVATGYLAWQGVDYFFMALRRFPFHLLSSIACVAMAVFFIFVLLDKKQHRIAALAIYLVLLAAAAISLFPKVTAVSELDLGDGGWICLNDDPMVSVKVLEDGRFSLSSGAQGSTVLDFQDENGEIRSFFVSIVGDQMAIEPAE